MWPILIFTELPCVVVLLKMGRKQENIYLGYKMVWVLRENISNAIAFL